MPTKVLDAPHCSQCGGVQLRNTRPTTTGCYRICDTCDHMWHEPTRAAAARARKTARTKTRTHVCGMDARAGARAIPAGVRGRFSGRAVRAAGTQLEMGQARALARHRVGGRVQGACDGVTREGRGADRKDDPDQGADAPSSRRDRAAARRHPSAGKHGDLLLDSGGPARSAGVDAGSLRQPSPGAQVLASHRVPAILRSGPS